MALINPSYVKSLDPKGIYVIEIPYSVKSEQLIALKDEFKRIAPDAKFIALCNGAKLSDVHLIDCGAYKGGQEALDLCVHSHGSKEKSPQAWIQQGGGR